MLTIYVCHNAKAKAEDRRNIYYKQDGNRFNRKCASRCAYFNRFKAGKYKEMSKWSLQVMQPHAGDLFNLKKVIQQ